MKDTTYMSQEAKVNLVRQFFAVSDNQDCKEMLELALTKDPKDHVPLPIHDLDTWAEFEHNVSVNFLMKDIDMSTKNTYGDLFKVDERFMGLFRDHLARLATTFCFGHSDMKTIKIPNIRSNNNHIHKYGMKFVDLIRKQAMHGGDFTLVGPDDPEKGGAYIINPEVYNNDNEGEREEVLAYEDNVSALFCIICISIMLPFEEEDKFLMDLDNRSII